MENLVCFQLGINIFLIMNFKKNFVNAILMAGKSIGAGLSKIGLAVLKQELG